MKRFYRGIELYPSLVQSIWDEIGMSLVEKIGLMIWGVLVFILPSKPAFAVARYVCNPASRKK